MTEESYDGVQFGRNDDKAWKTVDDVWRASRKGSGVCNGDYYQHYTTLSSVITKICQRRWWLTQSTNVRLNDLQESRKFGTADVAKRTYQTSFVHSITEDVSMWGLYAPQNPFAIRITIPGERLSKWIDEVKKKDQLHKLTNHKDGTDPIEKDFTDCRDVIYASVGGEGGDKYDIRRGNHLFWRGERSAEIKDLAHGIKRGICTGWFKDYEWRHENEARLCMRLKKANGQKAMWTEMSEDLLCDLRFTFSPWLPRCYEHEVEKIIRSAYEGAGIKLTKKCRQHFRRSSVAGALNFERERDLESFESSLSEFQNKALKGIL